MKFENLRANWRFWFLGLVVALGGVVIARVAAPYYTGKTQTVLVAIGRLISFAGLFFIALGLKRRAKNNSDENPPGAS